MAILYLYRCDCGHEVEDENPSPPLCSACNQLMPRKMRIFRGTALKSLNRKLSETEQGISEYEADQSKRNEGIRERKSLDRAAFRDYCRGELHIKHGNPDESTTALPDTVRAAEE